MQQDFLFPHLPLNDLYPVFFSKVQLNPLVYVSYTNAVSFCRL